VHNPISQHPGAEFDAGDSNDDRISQYFFNDLPGAEGYILFPEECIGGIKVFLNRHRLENHAG